MDSGTPTFDIIFVGAGASACVTAGRLSTWQPSLRILIIEAGGHTKDIKEHVQPARFFSNLLPGHNVYTFHTARPSEHVGGRALSVRTGKCVGGGSSINFMVYTRAAASDYDDWEKVYGNPGWGSKDMIPLLNKAEAYGVSESNEDIHGHSGPINISYGGIYTNTAQDFLATALDFDKARGKTDDVNGFFECDAYGRWPKYIDRVSGRRSDTAHAYIYNLEHPNLSIITNSRVVRVIFDGKRAVGVEYVDKNLGKPSVLVAYASKLVVLSAGAFGSPAILQRSGIGPGHVLRQCDIQQVEDLPGVGQNYQDHVMALAPFYLSDDAETMDSLFRQEPDALESAEKQWLATGDGPMAGNPFDAGVKLRPNSHDLKELGRDFELWWNDYFLPAPDKPVMWLGLGAGYLKPNSDPQRKFGSLVFHSQYSAGTGRLWITSATDPHAPLHFELGFLTDNADLAVLRWGYKFGREIIRRMALYRGEHVEGHPLFPLNSKAKCGEATGPVEPSAKNLEYSEEDNRAIDEWCRKTAGSCAHSLRTCSMKPREQGGVVDSKLNVYGLKQLKVADMSICPGNVGANTYNTALGIGEKAAMIIAEELHIQLCPSADL